MDLAHREIFGAKVGMGGIKDSLGSQWLSGRVLDTRSRGCGKG